MTTFVEELRMTSQNALVKQAKEEGEYVRKSKENFEKTMSSLISKYHPVIKKGLFETAGSGETQFRLVIRHFEDGALDDWSFEDWCPYSGDYCYSRIEPSDLTKELLNPNSKFLPFKKDGMTRDSFTGLTVKHDRAYFDDYFHDHNELENRYDSGLGYLRSLKTIYDFSC